MRPLFLILTLSAFCHLYGDDNTNQYPNQYPPYRNNNPSVRGSTIQNYYYNNNPRYQATDPYAPRDPNKQPNAPPVTTTDQNAAPLDRSERLRQARDNARIEKERLQDQIRQESIRRY